MPSVYANATSAEDRFVTALHYRLSQITIANGYRNTVKAVLDDPPVDPGEITERPTIVMLFPDEKPFEEDSASQAQMVHTVLYAHIEAASEPGAVVRSMKQDIKSVLGNFPQMQGENGIETCQKVGAVTTKTFGDRQTSPRFCLKVEFDAYLGAFTNDPSVAIA